MFFLNDRVVPGVIAAESHASNQKERPQTGMIHPSANDRRNRAATKDLPS
jgi:hypothetical protein